MHNWVEFLILSTVLNSAFFIIFITFGMISSRKTLTMKLFFSSLVKGFPSSLLPFLQFQKSLLGA